MSRRNLWELHECHEAVIRYGVDEPCDKTAVALRIDPEEGHPYPVCARHSRNGGSRMVPLADVVRPVVEELDRIAAAHDAAVARAEQAEQALEVLGRERNAWARQLADAHDERDTARAELEQVRSERSEDRQTVYRIEALIAEWEQLDRADGVHGRQLRRALDGTP